MGVQISKLAFDRVLSTWNEKYVFYAPKLFKDAGAFSDTDQVRYDHVMECQQFFRQKLREMLMSVSYWSFIT